jgi:hypothetical protein
LLEHLPPRQVLAGLNAHFDVKHISHDLHLAGLPDPEIYKLALKLGRIILTINVNDFRPLIRDDSLGVIGIPENWPAKRIDSKLTALFKREGPAYFRGRYRSLAAEDRREQAA